MACNRQFVLGFLIGSMALSSPPVQAFDGAQFGAGVAGAAIGAMIVGSMRPQTRYYYLQRHTYAPRYTRRRKARGPARETSSLIRVATDTPWITRTFYNCSNAHSVGNITAHAQHGFIQEHYSTRLNCGNTRHPVKEFTYMSPAGYAGSDRIEYVQGRKRLYTDILEVGNYNKPFEPKTQLVATSGQELELYLYRGCTVPDLHARANNGFARLREMTEPSDDCKGHEKIVKTVSYRTSEGFAGTDHVMLYSSWHAPINFTIEVSGSRGVTGYKPSSDLDAPPEEARPKASALDAPWRETTLDATPRTPPDEAALAAMLIEAKRSGSTADATDTQTMTCRNFRREYVVKFNMAKRTFVATVDGSDTQYTVLAVEGDAVTGTTPNGGPTYKASFSNKRIDFFENNKVSQTDQCH